MAPQYLSDLVDPAIMAKQHERTVHQLKTTPIPRHAFAVYSIPKYISKKVNGVWKSTISTGIVPMNLEDLPNQKFLIDDAMFNFNARMLCYGNFPTHDNKDAKRVQKWKQYNEPNQSNPWDIMAGHCQKLIDDSLSASAEIAKAREEGLEEVKKLREEAEALRAELEGKKQAKGVSNEKRA